jgi:hypothetical protein
VDTIAWQLSQLRVTPVLSEESEDVKSQGSLIELFGAPLRCKSAGFVRIKDLLEHAAGEDPATSLGQNLVPTTISELQRENR